MAGRRNLHVKQRFLERRPSRINAADMIYWHFDRDDGARVSRTGSLKTADWNFLRGERFDAIRELKLS